MFRRSTSFSTGIHLPFPLLYRNGSTFVLNAWSNSANCFVCVALFIMSTSIPPPATVDTAKWLRGDDRREMNGKVKKDLAVIGKKERNSIPPRAFSSRQKRGVSRGELAGDPRPKVGANSGSRASGLKERARGDSRSCERHRGIKSRTRHVDARVASRVQVFGSRRVPLYRALAPRPSPSESVHWLTDNKYRRRETRGSSGVNSARGPHDGIPIFTRCPRGVSPASRLKTHAAQLRYAPPQLDATCDVGSWCQSVQTLHEEDAEKPSFLFPCPPIARYRHHKSPSITGVHSRRFLIKSIKGRWEIADRSFLNLSRRSNY